MLTSRDKKIIKFMENTSLGLTINQAALMYWPKKFGYDYARLRLRKLWERGVLKRYTNDYSDELIYYFEKKPSFHKNAILNVYANFVSAGYNITHFKSEQPWMNGKYISDGFLIAENDKEIRIAIIEVDHSNITNMKKYEDLFESGELQDQYKIFPMVIILTDVEREYRSGNFTVIRLDIKCSGFRKVLQ